MKVKNKKLRNFFGMVFIFLVLSAFLSFFIDVKLAAVILFSALLILGYAIWKEKIGQELIIAFLFSMFVTSYYYYQYTSANIFLGKINIFPLVSWTFGLVLLREIYERIGVKRRFLAASLIYLFSLFLAEFAGYYLLNVRLASDSPGLLGLGVIHAPLWMKFFYIFAGPVYLAITDYLKVK